MHQKTISLDFNTDPSPRLDFMNYLLIWEAILVLIAVVLTFKLQLLIFLFIKFVEFVYYWK